MKKRYLFAILAIFFFRMINYSFEQRKTLKNDFKMVFDVITDEPPERINDWDLFISAMIWVESRGKHDAIGKLDDVGVLQLRPIMVDEANRIIKANYFTYEDRLDSLKSVEIFNVVQKHHNPNYCFKRATKIWNPTAGDWYYERIMLKYNELLAIEKIL